MTDYNREKLLSLSTQNGIIDPKSYLMFASAKNIDAKGHNLGNISFFASELYKFLPIKSESKNDYTKTLEKAIGHLILNPNPENAFVCTREACHICGEDVSVYFDGENFSIRDECREKIEEYSFDIAVPSGKICFANDLRSFFPDVDYYVNHFIGIKNTTRDYAKYGMFHPFVGNTCPAVVKRRNGIIEIGQFKGTNHICTDLWWLSACDASILKKWAEIAGKEWTDENDYADFIIRVKPGIYRCTTKPRMSMEDEPSCKMELISEVIPDNFTLFKEASETEAITDVYEAYLKNPNFDILRTFKQSISFYYKDTSSRDNGLPWFDYNYSSEKFNKEILKKYPDIDKFDISILENIPVFKNKTDVYQQVSNGQKHFNCSVEDFMKNKSYESYYTVFASIMLYAWSVLKNSNIEAKNLSDVKRIVALCAINLQERNLFENAITWIENLRDEVENEPENPKIKQNILDGMKGFVKILKSYDETIDVEQFIAAYTKNHNKHVF